MLNQHKNQKTMAKLILPHGWQLRGSSEGTTYSRGTYGAYIRTKVTPVNPSTPAQAGVRSNFGATAQAWRSLTEAQRFSWIQAAANFATTNIFGTSFTYTGFNLYVKVNRWLFTIGQAAVSTPPVPTAVTNSQLSALVSNITGGTVEATYSPTVAAAHTVIVYGTAPMSAGKKFVKSEYRKFAVLPAATASPQNHFTDYTALFGAITGKAGMKIFVKYLSVTNTGIAGVESSQSAIITA